MLAFHLHNRFLRVVKIPQQKLETFTYLPGRSFEMFYSWTSLHSVSATEEWVYCESNSSFVVNTFWVSTSNALKNSSIKLKNVFGRALWKTFFVRAACQYKRKTFVHSVEGARDDLLKPTSKWYRHRIIVIRVLHFIREARTSMTFKYVSESLKKNIFQMRQNTGLQWP